MSETTGVWTPEEAEAAFIEFGNLFVQLTAAQREHGDGSTPELAEARRLLGYVHTLSNTQLGRLHEFFVAMPEVIEAMHSLVDLELLARAMDRP